MTETKSRPKTGAGKVAEIQAHALAPARAELAKLDDGDLAEVLLDELDRRRGASGGNQPPGLYEAACAAILHLLHQLDRKDYEVFRQGDEPLPEEARDRSAVAVAERLAAVGRGVAVRSMDDETQAVAREIAHHVDAFLNTEMAPSERATQLAKTLEERFGRDIDTSKVAAALKRPSPHGRVAGLLLAAGIIVPRAEESEKNVQRRAFEAAKDGMKYAKG